MVISGVNTVTYNGDGITTAWPYTYEVTAASEIRIQLNNADGTAVIVESDYYVDLINSTVYYPGYAPGSEPPEAEQPPKVQEGQTITVYREIPITQESDLGDKWPFYVIEAGLDKLTMIAQQIDSGTKRTVDNALASMELLADVVVDSEKLQDITDQLNAIDANAAAAAESEENAATSALLSEKWANYTGGAVADGEYSAKKYATDAETSATNASNSASSATTTANALTNYLDTKETLTAPAVDPTLTISGAAADAKVTGDYVESVADSSLITFTAKQYIYTAVNVGAVIDLTPVTNNTISSAVVVCTAGDKITINGNGYTNGRLWAFVDANNRLIRKALASVTATDLVVIAPVGTAKCIINSFTSGLGLCYLGASVDSRKLNVVTRAGVNLFNPDEALNNIFVNGADSGNEASNNNRWCTGYIPYDSINHPYIEFPFNVYRVHCFNSNFEYIGVRSSAQFPWKVTDNTAYVRLSFEKTNISFEDRANVYVGYADQRSTVLSNKVINSHMYNPRPTGAFDINDIRQYTSDGLKTFTTSFSFPIYPAENCHTNMIVTSRAMWSGTDEPTIKFKCYYNSATSSDASQNVMSASIPYTIGGKGFYDVQEWRIPKLPNLSQYIEAIVNIPTGTTLYIDDIYNEYNNRGNIRNTGVRFNAHRGYAVPLLQDTIPAFVEAAKLGFDCCITIPKVTSDGVLVCFHDDAKIGSNFVDSNGDALSSTLQNTPISGFTYAQLLQYYYADKHTSLPFACAPKDKIVTLEQFFALCSQTGMHPMLSVHPPLSQSIWQTIKALASKYNVLKSLNVKVSPDADGTTITVPYSVLGNDIESYTVDVNIEGYHGETFINTYIASATATKTIEIFDTYITDELIASALSAGCKVACATTGRHPSSWFKTLMAKGVTEFTTDHFASVGLHW